jgi:hypothetical protein
MSLRFFVSFYTQLSKRLYGRHYLDFATHLQGLLGKMNSSGAELVACLTAAAITQ